MARSCFVNEVWHWLLGHWETAREYSDRGLAASPDDDRLLSHRVILECEAGDFPEARAYLDKFIEYMRHRSDGPILGHSYLAVAIAIFILFSGEEEYFEAGHASVNQILRSSTATPVITMWARIAAGLLAMLQGDVDIVRKQLACLRPHKGTMVIPDTMAVDRLLGLLARTAGDEDEAMAHFEESLSFCRRTGYKSELASK